MATLLATWAFRIAPPNVKVLGNVTVIVLGVVIASFGEIKFVFSGFMFQVGGVVFEALRLVLVQRLLSSGDFKMDPLVSLYYFAPACAVTNGLFTAIVELPRLTMNDIYNLGPMILLANAFVAFLLNVSGVLLVSNFSVSTGPVTDRDLEDWQNLGRRPYHVRRPEGCATGLCIHDPVPRPCYWPAVLRLLHRSRWTGVLQARRGQAPLPGQGHAAADLPVSPEQPGEGEACGRSRYLYGRLSVDVDMGPGLNQPIYRVRKGSRWVRGVKESGFPGRERGRPSVF